MIQEIVDKLKKVSEKDATSSDTDSNENFDNSENSWDFNLEKLTKILKHKAKKYEVH